MALETHNKSLFLVTGPGRSGTSLLTKMLQALGVDPVGELTGPSIHNPEGAFENRFVFDTHRRIIKNSKLDHTAIIDHRMIDKPRRKSAQKAIANYLQEVEKESDSIVIKDPILSYMLPIWGNIIKELAIKPVILIAIRDPRNILSSYVNNYSINQYIAEMIILHRLASSVVNSFGIATVINYDNWFNGKKGKQIDSLIKTVTPTLPELKAGKKELLNITSKQLDRSSARPLEINNQDLTDLFNMLAKLKPGQTIPNKVNEFAADCLKRMEPHYNYSRQLQAANKSIDDFQAQLNSLKDAKP